MRVNGIEITEENAGRIVGNPNEELIPLMDNPYIKGIFGDRIFYTDDFYVDLHKKIAEGHTYVEAYQSLGFDLNLLGKKRAEQAGKRAVKMAKEGKLNAAPKPEQFNGSIPMDQMTGLNPEEWAAYCEARAIYLEHYLKVLKKTRLELEKSLTS
jgi:hypothetical protein